MMEGEDQPLLDAGVINKEEELQFLLPSEIYAHIFRFLSTKDLQSALSVNTQWRDIICWRRRKVIARDQSFLDRFSWSLFPNIHNITIIDLSLRSVPNRVSTITVINTMRDYEHLLNVTTLNVRYTLGTEQCLNAFSNLKTLRIRGSKKRNSAISVPSCANVSHSLTSLTLDEQLWPRWAENLTLLKKLTILGEVKLCKPEITFGSFKNMAHLTQLTIRNQSLRDTVQVSLLTQLQLLHIFSCRDLNISEQLHKLNNLTSLSLMVNIPPNILCFVTCLQNLTDLESSYYYLELADISSMTRLKRLAIVGNKLKEVPAILLPACLKVLDLGYNKLKSLEVGFSHYFTRLLSLNIDMNKFRTLNNLPTTLVQLYASRIKITDAKFISGLHNLVLCELRQNMIETVPDLTKNTRLRRLNLSSNRVTSSTNPIVIL